MSTNKNDSTTTTTTTIDMDTITVKTGTTRSQQGLANRLPEAGTIGYDRIVADTPINERFDDLQFASLVGMPKGWIITLSNRKGISVNVAGKSTRVNSLSEIALGVVQSHVAAVKAGLAEGEEVGKVPAKGADRAKFMKANFKIKYASFDNDGLITSAKTITVLENMLPRAIEAQARRIAKAEADGGNETGKGAKFVSSVKSLASRAANVELTATEKAEAIAALSKALTALTK